jgi:DNA-binding NarL/FixJ family response regulator
VKVRLITDDLLFGSKVEAMIREAGGEQATEGEVALTILDLTDAGGEVAKAVEFARAGGAPILAYYSHVDDDVRRAALEAGVEKLVPRSRMMREGAALIAATAA